MHIIEAHVPQFLDQKHFCFFFENAGLGEFLEQGSEAVHHDFDNELEHYKRDIDHRDYAKQLLRCTSTYHLRHVLM